MYMMQAEQIYSPEPIDNDVGELEWRYNGELIMHTFAVFGASAHAAIKSVCCV